MEVYEVVRQELGEAKIPIVYAKTLNENVLAEMEKVRKHSGNYLTLFVRNVDGRYKPYFGSCQTDHQLRAAIAEEESVDAKGDSRGFPLMNGFAGSIPLSEDGKVSSIFLNSRGGELGLDLRDTRSAIKAVASNIERGMFQGNSIPVVVDCRQEYIFDTESMNIFKKIR